MQTSPSCPAALHPVLDQNSLAAYARDGFARLGSVMDATTLQQLRADESWLRNQSTLHGKGPSTHFWSLVHKHCPAVRRLGCEGAQVDAVESILGPNIALWFNQFVTKMPGGEQEAGTFPWHQDNGYVDVAPNNNVTVWIALDDVDVHNGCVWVVPGSHLRGLLAHQQPQADSWHLSLPIADDGIPVPLAAGEAVLFSGYTLHRSLANHRQQPRRALFYQYAEADARLPTRNNLRVCEHPDSWVVRGRASLLKDTQSL